MKNICFLRHGQTSFNKSWIYQFPETPLSDVGKKQAHAIAEKLKNTTFDVILASTYLRAVETAQIVAQATGKPVEYSDLLVELRRPQELWGKSWFSPKSIFIMGTSYFRATQPKWHYSDEENLEEFRLRSLQALDFILANEAKNVLVVTHAGLMSNMISCIKHGNLDSLREYRRALWKTLRVGNCCYVEATWQSKEETENKKATWTLKEGKTCPF
jgi:broad specificity phosphatase PhoE